MTLWKLSQDQRLGIRWHAENGAKRIGVDYFFLLPRLNVCLARLLLPSPSPVLSRTLCGPAVCGILASASLHASAHGTPNRRLDLSPDSPVRLCGWVAPCRLQPFAPFICLSLPFPYLFFFSPFLSLFRFSLSFFLSPLHFIFFLLILLFSLAGLCSHTHSGFCPPFHPSAGLASLVTLLMFLSIFLGWGSYMDLG